MLTSPFDQWELAEDGKHWCRVWRDAVREDGSGKFICDYVLYVYKDHCLELESLALIS
jgi:hypothetical protein